MPTSPALYALPVVSRLPARIDVLTGFNGDTRQGDAAVWQMLQALAAIQPDRGCILLHGVNVERQQVLFQNLNSRNADWAALAGKIRAANPATVDLATLESRTRITQFLGREINRLLADESGCEGGEQDLPRSFVILSWNMEFPAGNNRATVEPTGGQRIMTYYFRRANRWRRGGQFGPYDDLAGLLKPLRPRRLDIDTPEEFRKSLAVLVDDLRRGQSGAPVTQSH